jgi:peptidoglycan/xylan/chitin deacetylase (PgdA/CDA1 family)
MTGSRAGEVCQLQRSDDEDRGNRRDGTRVKEDWHVPVPSRLVRSRPYSRLTHEAHRLQAFIGRERQDVRTQASGNVLRVLGYHRIADDADELAVRPRAFRRQMERLLALGAQPLSLDDAPGLLNEGVDRFYVCVTFDDGYHDNLMEAVPVLRELRIPATIFVPTAAIDGTARLYWYAAQPRLLSWRELRELSADSLFSVGSHTRRHPDLTRLTQKGAWEEIAGSKAELEDRLGVPATSFAYPAGCMSEREARMVVEAGYTVAVTTRPGPNHAGMRPDALRRNFIERRDDESLLEAKLAGLLDAPWTIRRPRSQIQYAD